MSEEQKITVTATDLPEKVVDDLKTNEEFKKQLVEKLGGIKNLLDSIEESKNNGAINNQPLNMDQLVLLEKSVAIANSIFNHYGLAISTNSDDVFNTVENDEDLCTISKNIVNIYRSSPF